MTWQPIETAPKDEVLDLWDGMSREVECFWIENGYVTTYTGRMPSHTGWVMSTDDGDVFPVDATHWMRPPDAPTT